MGMHTKANAILQEHHLNPNIPHRTVRSDRSRTADGVVKALGDYLTKEGLIRLYAPVKAAEKAVPSFKIGDGPRSLLKAIEKEIGKGDEKTSHLQEIAKIKTQLADLEARVRGK